MKGLLLLAGKGKPKMGGDDSEEESPPSSEREGASEAETMALEDAFDAAKSGDKDAFVSRIREAIEACIERYNSEGY